MITRALIAVDTDTGTQSLIGGPINGELHQLHWVPSTPDTGGDLAVFFDPDPDDTGKAITVLDHADCLGVSRSWAPRQPTHDVSGAGDITDTGTPAAPVPFVAAVEQLRVKVTPGGAAVAGTLFIWTKVFL